MYDERFDRMEENLLDQLARHLALARLERRHWNVVYEAKPDGALEIHLRICPRGEGDDSTLVQVPEVTQAMRETLAALDAV